MKISEPKFTYTIYYEGKYVDPKPFIKDIDSYLKYLYRDAPTEDCGLLIEYDAKPWNKDLFDSSLNMASWFYGISELIRGKKRVFVHAFEESNCHIEKGEDNLIIEDKGNCPKVIFNFNEFTKRILDSGQLFLEFEKVVKQRLDQLKNGPKENKVPELVNRWAEDMPDKIRIVDNVDMRIGMWEELEQKSITEYDLNELAKSIETIRQYTANENL